MLERLTDRAQRALMLAREEAHRAHGNVVGTEHLLLGLIDEDQGVAHQALESFGVTPTAARQRIAETIGAEGTSRSGLLPFTAQATRVLEVSLREALQPGHRSIGTEHLLLALIRDGEGMASKVLVSLGLDLGRLRDLVFELMPGTSPAEDIEASGSAAPDQLGG